MQEKPKPQTVTLSWEDYLELTKGYEALVKQVRGQNEAWMHIKDLCHTALSEHDLKTYKNCINTILRGLK